MTKHTFMYIIGLASVVAVANFAVYRLTPPPSTRVSVSPELLDVGEVTQAPFTGDFSITNQSNLEVTLLEPKTSCTCTKVVIPQQVLPPGGSVQATAEFKGGSNGGDLQTLVLIPYKYSGGTGEISLSTRAKVLPHISLSPKSITIDMDEEKPVEIVCQSNYDPEVSVTQVNCTSSLIDISISKETGSRTKIILTPKSIVGKADSLLSEPAYVSVSTTSKWMPHVRVPLLLKMPVARNSVSLSVHTKGK
ncbi:DUF1573 domain-containing protein [Gimesia aquarii]|uniref:DUF1573 domain-containing protein n=1 Tax=Gimesia aquarii TaxID=2527964 RepID=A0A517WU01_9PLAN|nr:DUF1573 domain-containing protein [Gimesia aquarii]QDU08737.1 hypothetical protein V202x_21070 [Gimesia aquarii]